jgi:hypothetical protein
VSTGGGGQQFQIQKKMSKIRHGKEHASEVFCLLNVLSYLIHGIQDMADEECRKARGSFGRRGKVIYFFSAKIPLKAACFEKKIYQMEEKTRLCTGTFSTSSTWRLQFLPKPGSFDENRFAVLSWNMNVK